MEGHHNPNKARCPDFHEFQRRLQVIQKIVWKIGAKEWSMISGTNNLKVMMMRLFKMAQVVGEQGEKTMKSVAEVATMLMRLEQSRINGGKDEVRIELTMKKLQKLFRVIRRCTNYMAMK